MGRAGFSVFVCLLFFDERRLRQLQRSFADLAFKRVSAVQVTPVFRERVIARVPIADDVADSLFPRIVK